MSTWQVGRVYDYYGTPIRCVRRWFDGALELVALQYVGLGDVVGAGAEPHPFVRTARALSVCVVPRVTETLGGVYRGDACEHLERYGRVLADAGPHAGKVCCMACGTPPTGGAT